MVRCAGFKPVGGSYRSSSILPPLRGSPPVPGLRASARRHGDSTRHTANVPERSKGEVLRTSGWEQPRGFEPRRWQLLFLRVRALLFLVVWPSG